MPVLELDLDKVWKPKKRKKRPLTAAQMGRRSWKNKISDPDFDRVAYLKKLSKQGNKAQAAKRRADGENPGGRILRIPQKA